MDLSEKNTIQSSPSRNASERPATPSIFSGTVTGVKQEKGIQTLEVQYSQGKVKFAADGDFQTGEKVRLSFPGGNTVQVAKGGAANEISTGSSQTSGYILPENLSSLREFEESIAKWANKSGGQAPTPSMQMSLPELLLHVMDKSGGKKFLSQAFSTLDKNLLASLIEAMESSKGDPGAKSALMDLLKMQGRVNDQSQDLASLLGSKPGARGLKNLDGFWPGEAGVGAAPWFGRVMDKAKTDSGMSELNKLQYGVGNPASKGDSTYRYQLDVGGRRMEVFSTQSLEIGDLADFAVEARGGRMHAKFMDPLECVPANLRSDFTKASASLQQAMQVSARYLDEFKNEPYHLKLVQDFSEVLDQSGLLKSGSESAKATLPDQQKLDALMRLLVSFPRDKQNSENQAKAWGDAVKNPQAMQDILKALKPLHDASLLRSDTGLQLTQNPSALLMPNGNATSANDALLGWLKKMLPEGFNATDLQKLAEDPVNLLTLGGKEADSSKFLLQSVAHNFPRDDELRQGKPGEFFFYQGQEWHGLQVKWEKGHQGEQKGKGGPKEPLKVHVETQAKLLGKVNVAVTLEPKGARIDFKNQFHDIREIFSQSLPELEKSLDYIDFKIAAWSYSMLPEEPLPVHSGLSQNGWTLGWTTPGGLTDNANLDLFG